MALPQPPPDTPPIWSNPERLQRIMGHFAQLKPAAYWHWDELRHRPAPAGLSHEEWWAGVKLLRAGAQRILPFRDRRGMPFKLGAPDRMHEALHQIDVAMGGRFSEK